ncbi:MAG TPA: DUF1573 domain-containing protein [Verrucomicrobiae bacterium]|jgi:cytochrome c5
MKLKWAIFYVPLLALFASTEILIAQSSNDTPDTPPASSPPVYAPDSSHENDPMPDGVLGWNSLMLSANLSADASQAHFLFSFTNISRAKVSILDVHASCNCTTAQLPPLPWTISAGGSGQIPVTVEIEDRTGTFFKSINVTTDKGMKQLLLQINVRPPVPRTMTGTDRARAIATAKIDRQAVFHNDCATCHVQPGEGKYGGALFEADCAICHEAEHRASFVPDLHNLKIPTNPDFWTIWIAHGKPGSFMPAFSQNDGGPLTDMQVASLAVYLNEAIPSSIPAPPQ